MRVLFLRVPKLSSCVFAVYIVKVLVIKAQHILNYIIYYKTCVIVARAMKCRFILSNFCILFKI